jgi:hypothetical protein
MLLVLARPELQKHCAKCAVPFMQAFIAAWLEGTHTPYIFTARERFIEIWAQGEFELICFSVRKCISSLTELAQKRKKKMEDKSIVVSPSEDGFVAQVQGLSGEEVRDLGPAMAAGWAYLNVQAMHEETKKEASGLEDVFADFSIDVKPSTMNLELVIGRESL